MDAPLTFQPSNPSVIAELAQSAGHMQELIATLEARLAQSQAMGERKIQAEFQRLAESWRAERGVSSNMVKIHLQPSYQRIIGMGPAVLPHLLAEMQRKPDHWFWALRAITGEDPVPTEHAGNLPAMTQDWLAWAKGKGMPIAGEH